MMSGFQSMPLGEVISFANGKSIKPGGMGQYPVYGSNGLIGGNEEFRHENAIIVGRVGAYCGSVAYCKGKFWASDNTIVAFPKNEQFDIEFLYYLLQFTKLGNYAGGAAQPLVTQTVLKQVPVKVPPLPTQKQIAGVLSAYDELIENNRRRIKILEEMARSLYREWFVHFRYPSHAEVPLVDSPLGPIPQWWEVKKVGDLLAKRSRQKKIKKQDYIDHGALPVIDQGRELIGGFTDNLESAYTSDLPVVVFGDHTRVLKFIDFPFACGADGTQLLHSSDERMPISLLYYTVSNIDLSNYGYARHFKFLKEEEVIVPSVEVAKAFTEKVGQMRKHMSVLQKQMDNLRNTRDLVLPKLLSGEIDLLKVEEEP